MATLPCAPADRFALTLDGLITRSGGPGNIGQLVCLLERPIAEPDVLATAWQRWGNHYLLAQAEVAGGLRGWRWHIGRRPPPPLTITDHLDLFSLADQERPRVRLDEADGRVRLAVTHGPQPALILTWHHALMDAPGACGVISQIVAAMDAERTDWQEPWWQSGYRQSEQLPQRAAEIGRLAQRAPSLIKPHRLLPVWQPPGAGAHGAGDIERLHWRATDAQNKLIKARQKEAAGRLAEMPFLAACTASALQRLGGAAGEVLLPLAVDARQRGRATTLANKQSFAFLRLPAGQALADLGAAARSAKEGYRDWCRSDGLQVMDACFHHLDRIPQRLVRQQLGFDRPGLLASCLFASAGPSALPTTIGGAAVVDVHHHVTLPARPGLAVLWHRWQGRLGVDLIATRAIVQHTPLAHMLEALQYSLCEQPINHGQE